MVIHYLCRPQELVHIGRIQVNFHPRHHILSVLFLGRVMWEFPKFCQRWRNLETSTRQQLPTILTIGALLGSYCVTCKLYLYRFLHKRMNEWRIRDSSSYDHNIARRLSVARQSNLPGGATLRIILLILRRCDVGRSRSQNTTYLIGVL